MPRTVVNSIYEGKIIHIDTIHRNPHAKRLHTFEINFHLIFVFNILKVRIMDCQNGELKNSLDRQSHSNRRHLYKEKSYSHFPIQLHIELH